MQISLARSCIIIIVLKHPEIGNVTKFHFTKPPPTLTFRWVAILLKSPASAGEMLQYINYFPYTFECKRANLREQKESFLAIHAQDKP